MSTAFLVYNLAVLLVLLFLLGVVVVNLLVLPRLRDYKPANAAGTTIRKVAVLVPVRNEEANIEACLDSLLSQDYPALELWLYDDASIDATLSVVREACSRIAPNGARLRVLQGTDDLPPGWLGKAHACHRLYLGLGPHSAPDYLLFTDADVRCEPGALSHAVALAQATGAGLVSIFPRQVTVTWAERLAVPLLQHWAVYTLLPLPLAFMSRTGPVFSAANGQFMLFTRAAYEQCGGHAQVRSEILEDVALARAVKKAGHRVMLADGGALVRTRMYATHGEVWRGYSKNTYAFFGYHPVLLVAGITALALLYIAPPIIALYALLSGQFTVDLFYLPLAQYGVAVLARVLLALRFDGRIADSALHPLAIAYLIAILLNSMLWSINGKSVWKGRSNAGRRVR
ncbi:MAG TPA: glycosyltransferase family 2 protein [Chloroflexia bacterium]|jgi:chlorobactene glucosyltransferase